MRNRSAVPGVHPDMAGITAGSQAAGCRAAAWRPARTSIIVGVLGALGAACAASVPARPATVPWVDRPGSMFSGSPLPVAPPPATGRACSAADVRVTASGGNGGGGHLYRSYDFRNAGTAPCILRGFPRVVASEPGKPAFVATDGGFFVGHDDVAATLSPGESATLSLETDTNCAARYAVPDTFPTNVYHTVTVSIPGGGNVVLAGDFDVECGLFTGQFSVAQPPQQYTQSPVAGVTVELEVPNAVMPGDVLHYVVALTNPTSHDMVLDPCPGYQQGIGAAGKAIRALNCEAVRTIAAGRTVRFAMQLDVPANTPAGPSQIHWNLAAITDVMISASASIDVERAAVP